MSIEWLLFVVLHLACLGVQVLMLRYGLKRRRLYTFFFLAVAFYQAVSLLALADLLQTYGARTLLHAQLIAAAGTLIVAAVIVVGDGFIPLRGRAEGAAGPLEAVVARPWTYLAITIGCLILATALTLRGGMSFADRTWQEARLDSSYLDSLATFLLFIAFPAAWIAKRSGHTFFGIFLLLWTLTLFVVFGSRAALLTLPMVVALDYFGRFGTVEVKARTIALIVVAAFGLHVAGRLVRGFGLAGLLAIASGQTPGTGDFRDAIEHLDLSGGEAAIYRYFLFVVSTGTFTDVEPLTSVVRWLGMYVPGAMFTEAKPVDLTYTIWWHAYSAGIFDSYESFGELIKVVGIGGSGSLHALVWGEMWANGGWPAVPVFAVTLAVLLLVIDAVYVRVPGVAYVLAAPATLIGYVMVARGNSVIGFGYTAFVLPMALLGYLFWRGLTTLFRSPSPYAGGSGNP